MFETSFLWEKKDVWREEEISKICSTLSKKRRLWEKQP
jgi:hypothetical protein